MLLIILLGILVNLVLAIYLFRPSGWSSPRRLLGKTTTLVAAEASFSILAMLILGAPVSALVAVSSVAVAASLSPAAIDVIRRFSTVRKKRREVIDEDMEIPMDEALFKRLCSYMEHKKPFLVESLTLGDVASAMFTNTLYLSRTINACSGKNFRRFINDYRVDYAMTLFRRNMSLKVSELAEMSGFHTVVTFNMAFKLVKGVTPSVWCQSERFSVLKSPGRATSP